MQARVLSKANGTPRDAAHVAGHPGLIQARIDHTDTRRTQRPVVSRISQICSHSALVSSTRTWQRQQMYRRDEF